jgi:hypothetical protein
MKEESYRVQYADKADKQASGSQQLDNGTIHRVNSAVSREPESPGNNETSQSDKKPNKRDYLYLVLVMCAIAVLMIWRTSRSFLDAHNGSISALATVAIMILTVFYVMYAKNQWHVMDGQLKQMQKQATEMERQTRHIEGSVIAAKTSADIAAGVSIPTLIVHEFGFGDMGLADNAAMIQYPKIKLTVKNYGQTPAFLLRWWIKFTCEELPEVPVYGEFGIALEKMVVQSGEERTLPSEMPLARRWFSLEDIKAILEREKTLRVYGYIVYGNIFDHRVRRLKFCETLINILGPHQFEWTGDEANYRYRGNEQAT